MITGKQLEIVNGLLLGDGCIFEDKRKLLNGTKSYYRFKLTAKDSRFVKWVSEFFDTDQFSISRTRDKRNDTHILYLRFEEVEALRNKWYTKINGKAVKIVPPDLKLTPTTLLFWYLGDGSLCRRKNDDIRIPAIVLATNNFLKSDVLLLKDKLSELGLNFSLVRYKSGFTGDYCGYVLRSKTSDETPYRFFNLIGFNPPEEIADAITGRKGKDSKLHKFKDKWPTHDEALRILSNVKDFGKIFKMRRKQMGLTQKELAKLIGVSREHVRDIENCKRCGSFRVFKKIYETLFNYSFCITYSSVDSSVS